ncbi:hypothetical protein V6N12_062036 [Hibiscus sabdariffa]|uniref:Uncharacterized protein n=1 Tax=Hibiscus sabdariffa TaxID=183260 RepID=A0ABR2DYU0_9ROSI
MMGLVSSSSFNDPFARMFDSCNGLICIQLYHYDNVLKFLLWNPSIQKYIYLLQLSFSEAEDSNIGFGFDSRTNYYKLLIVGVDKDGYRKRNNGEYIHAILGFDLSVEEFFEINFPESLSGLVSIDLSIMKYGEYSIVVTIHPTYAKLELSYVVSLVLLDKPVNVRSECDVNHPIDSTDSDEPSGGESDLAYDCPSFIPTPLHASLARPPNNTPFILLIAIKARKETMEEWRGFGASGNGEISLLDLNCQQMDPHGVLVGTGLMSYDWNHADTRTIEAFDTSPEVVIFVTQQCLKYPRLTGRAVVQLIIEKGNDEVGGEPRKMAFSTPLLMLGCIASSFLYTQIQILPSTGDKQGTLLAGFLFVCGLIQSSSPNKLIITGETFSVPSYILLSAIELFLVAFFSFADSLW